MGNEEPRNSHVIPGMRADIEADLQFMDPPVTLDGGPGITIDGEIPELFKMGREIAQPAPFKNSVVRWPGVADIGASNPSRRGGRVGCRRR